MSDPEKKPVWKNPFATAFVLGALVLTALPFLQERTLRAPEPIASLGSWQLVDEQGKPFGSADLKGKVWIASFFFTRCPSVCPRQQESLLKTLPHLDDLLTKDGVSPVSIVSFSVDPDYDTPDVLAKYQQKMRASSSVPPTTPGEWKLLTGDRDKMKELLVKHFLVEMGDKKAIEGSADLFDISHVARFALVDQNGDLRGFWGIDDEGRGNLINAARLLAKKGPRP
jgi:protein SCO1/2